jgi:hypothetical protein
MDINNVSPQVTYIKDPDVVAPVTPVILMSGSIALNLNPGDIQIGDVAIKDEDSGLEAQILLANAAKSTGNNVLLVQTVDVEGGVLRRSDITNIDAGISDVLTNQHDALSNLAVVMNGPGNLRRIMLNYPGAVGAKCAVYDGINDARTWQSWGTLFVGLQGATGGGAAQGPAGFQWDYAEAPFFTGLTIVNTADMNIIYE